MDLNLGVISKSMLWLLHIPTEEIKEFKKFGVNRHIQSGSLGNLAMYVMQDFGRLSFYIAKRYTGLCPDPTGYTFGESAGISSHTETHTLTQHL